jgi:hypothetical protein
MRRDRFSMRGPFTIGAVTGLILSGILLWALRQTLPGINP